MTDPKFQHNTDVTPSVGTSARLRHEFVCGGEGRRALALKESHRQEETMGRGERFGRAGRARNGWRCRDGVGSGGMRRARLPVCGNPSHAWLGWTGLATQRRWRASCEALAVTPRTSPCPKDLRAEPELRAGPPTGKAAAEGGTGGGGAAR